MRDLSVVNSRRLSQGSLGTEGLAKIKIYEGKRRGALIARTWRLREAFCKFGNWMASELQERERAHRIVRRLVGWKLQPLL